MEYDYEQVEEHFGSILRNTNYVDLSAGVFLPVKFIGRLMAFAESQTAEAKKKDADVRVSILNKEFNRWVDDMVAQLELKVISDMGDEPVTCQLIDVEYMQVSPGMPLTVVLTGERGRHTVLDSEDEAVSADDLKDLKLNVDFSRLLEHDLQGIEYLASLLIRAAMAMKTELTAEMFDGFSNRFFDYFKFDLEQLTPSILEDLQTISDHRLVKLGIL